MRAKIQKISKYAPSIFQGRLDLGQRAAGGVSLTVEHPAERYLFKVLVVVVTAVAISYAYFVGSSILNVIARKEATSDAARLANAVASLERDYFKTTQAVGAEDGRRLGLVPLPGAEYVHGSGRGVAAAGGNELQ